MLIDGSPDLMKSMIDHFWPSSTKEELQNNVLLGIMDALKPSASEKVNLVADSLKRFQLSFDPLLMCFPL